MTVYNGNILGKWTGFYEKDVDGRHVEFLGIKGKKGDKEYMDSLEDNDLIYLYHQEKRILKGHFVRPGTSATNVYLVVEEDKPQGNPEMILSYENLKLFFRSNFQISVYRRLDRNVYGPELRRRNGVTTARVP